MDGQFDWAPRETDPGQSWPAQPGYGWPPQPPAPEPPPEPPNQNRRNALIIAAAVLCVLVLVVALINGVRNRGGSSSGIAQPLPTGGPTAVPSPGPSGGTGGGSGGGFDPTLPLVACPNIVDDQSHLAYRCIDDNLRQGLPDSLLGLRIALNRQVEVGWIISEGSGNPKSVAAPSNPSVIGYRQAVPTAAPSLAAITGEVRRRTALAVSKAYGDGPTSKVLNQHSLTVSGATGFELVTEITINDAYRASTGLATKTERLWVVGVPTKAGISIFMMSIPDRRKDLWPKAEATVGTLRII